MKILLLSDFQSSHTQKWIKSLSEIGIELILFGLDNINYDFYNQFPLVKCYSGGFNKKPESLINIFLKESRYLSTISTVKRIIRLHQPDIVHAHYASSYGLIGSLTNFHPFIISLWGSDILKFPSKSFVHKKIIMHNLKKSDKVLATSSFLANEGKKFSQKDIQITNFGVNSDIFKCSSARKIFKKEDIVIGTVKALEKTYGIDILIHAFSLLKRMQEDLPLKLMIVGQGALENELKNLCISKGIWDVTTFTGYIPHELIQEYHNELDIEVYMSRMESFGVSVLEAMACAKPVVVSNIECFKDIIDDSLNGYVVPSDDINKIVNILNKLIHDQGLRNLIGSRAREKVIEKFNWEDDVDKMICIYKSLII
jgi:L-malate glycosyltransferase